MKLLAVGDNVVDRYPSLARLYPGGNAVNVAVFAARLGASSGYLGQIGSDLAGDHMLRSLVAENVDVTATWRVQEPNAYADVELQGEDRVFLGSNRSGALFDLTREHAQVARQYDVVHAGYASSVLPHVPELAELSRVSFDFGSRYDFEQTLGFASHLFLAAYSASHLSNSEARQLVIAARAAGAQYALATRGGHGAYLSTPTGAVIFQAADRIAAVDTLGAGDAFIATVLVGLISGRSPQDALASAASHAAQVCLDHGAFGHPAPYDPASSPAEYTNLPSHAQKAINT
ncbi:PfkB family carbohydrate kinase [Pseudarthrobacter sp. RMG13]|uniref:PfkB family carbohydrate kinase n=1 Tax=Pseudarthrobacter humi TaxID=2952523 RepID=A0ABT1LN39_9MICC|nr:PfkB family carbohydrate kinase [Pseudarthrobacter humi]MCP8999850.1 PfkB family carbohydrate kinase [Pseudarthrobacter humi]